MLRAIKNLTYDELGDQLSPWGLEPYRINQIVDWLYLKRVADFQQMSNIPESLQTRLAEHFHLTPVVEQAHQVSKLDGTHKLLLEFSDGQAVETVLMLRKTHSTVCVSSQVGCRFACKFCLTAKKGLIRNLTSDEIVQQVLHVRQHTEHPGLNIVFMGMGEPLDNFDEVVQAIRILTSPRLASIGARRVTVSTTGVVDRIRQLADLDLRIRLAISLNATTDSERKHLMPVSGRNTIKETLEAARYFSSRSNHHVTLEYVLLHGVNDRDEDLTRLQAFGQQNAPFKLNLIPFNPDQRLVFKRPALDRVRIIQERLQSSFHSVTVRWSQGLDIDAACGQLFGNNNNASAA